MRAMESCYAEKGTWINEKDKAHKSENREFQPYEVVSRENSEKNMIWLNVTYTLWAIISFSEPDKRRIFALK